MLSLEIVNNPNLSARSLGVIAFILASKSNTIGIEEIQKRFGFGSTVWRQISKELREQHFLVEQRGNGGTQLLFKLPE